MQRNEEKEEEIPGSASVMAMDGSALECSRLDSFSACVSDSFRWWPPWLVGLLFCDLSERKLKARDLGRWLLLWEAAWRL